MRSEKKNQKGLEINVVAFFKELSKKLWIVLIVALIGAIIGAVVSEATKKETYTSTASFVVNTLLFFLLSAVFCSIFLCINTSISSLGRSLSTPYSQKRSYAMQNNLLACGTGRLQRWRGMKSADRRFLLCCTV